eukprot:TRINITY_DN2430_c0_g1_i2.p2 TRINITY_DN2430_c0_g1~~TRINITY_DN2430_c0_g1_i2.p2  ORF type:complete len:186 (+),score=51.43 TRINITY_DN2430_c0_g1_i2:75-632(+)
MNHSAKLFLPISCTLVFCAASIGCGLYALMPNTPWYKSPTVLFPLSGWEETFNKVKDGDYDDLFKLYQITFGTIALGLACEVVLACAAFVLALFYFLCHNRVGHAVSLVIKLVAVLVGVVGTAAMTFGALYFIRHPYYMNQERSLCPVKSYACDSFIGHTEYIDTKVEWHPGVPRRGCILLPLSC